MKISRFVVVLIFVLSNGGSFAQTIAPAPLPFTEVTLGDIRKLQRTALESDYAYSQTAYLSNNIGPRLSGSVQAQRAVEYVADEMRKLGLNVRLQKLTVPHWVRGEEKGDLVEWSGMAPGSTQKVVLTALGGSIATPTGGIVAEIVVVNSFEELAARGRKEVEGRIVLFNGKFDRQLARSGFGGAAYGQAVQFRGGGAIAAGRLGAVAVLVRSAGGSQNRLVHTGAMRYEDSVTKIPAAAVSFEDAELIDHLTKLGTVKMRMLLTPRQLPDATGYNVIADLKGSERPEEIVIISGHLDSWDLGTGALDDACGVAVAMQVPFLVKKLGLKPKRTIRFVAYMNEENGLVGGNTYANEEKANVANHFAAIESDLGASHPVGFLFAGKAEALTLIAPLSNILRSQGAGMTQMQAGVGADIGPLTRLGVPSFAPWFDTRTYFDYHHTEADTLDKIDPNDLRKVGAVMAVLAYGLANMDQPLPR